MVRASFPSAISRFIALESHIALKKNSLNKLAAFEKRVLDQTTEKTREMAGPLLQKIENRRTELVNRQLTKLKSQEEWIEKTFVGMIESMEDSPSGAIILLGIVPSLR